MLPENVGTLAPVRKKKKSIKQKPRKPENEASGNHPHQPGLAKKTTENADKAKELESKAQKKGRKD